VVVGEPRGVRLLKEALQPSKPHVYFSVGKGGVGKTTVSILASLALEGEGRVLLASMDPAKHLLEYLGLRRVAKPEEVRGTSFQAVQYDVDTLARKTAEDYARLLRQVMPGLTIVNLEGIVRAVKYAPGFEEEVFLRILKDLTSRLGEDYDFLVIDTPPTGVTHRMLNLPRLYLLWLSRLYELRYKIVSMRYAIARVMQQEFEPHDPVLDKLASLHEEYKALADLLKDHRRSSLILVATPEPLPVFELRNSIEVAQGLGMRVSAIIVNRVMEPSMASKLGIAETQERSLREVAELDCGGCRKLAILHSPEPPNTLEGARRLLGLVRPLDEVLSG
jgi:arsenite-transporting ATPase